MSLIDPINPIPVINGVGTYVQCILNCQSQFEKKSCTSYFRGHADKDKYQLAPSLLRDPAYLKHEDKMFRELVATNPFDFKDDCSTFDKLARMQHYAMPTRLLDITTNPLMALYFACGKATNEAIDGEVIAIGVKHDALFYYDSDTTSVISNLARLDLDAKEIVANEATKAGSTQESFNNHRQVKRLHHFIREEKSYFRPTIRTSDIGRIICVRGKMNNQRISSQAGAFLLFGHNTFLNDNGKQWMEIERFTIPGRCKEKIINELDLLDINESTVFPGVESSAKYICQKFFKQTNSLC